MKTVNEYLELVERTLPDLKASDRLYVVGLLQDAYREGLDDMSNATMEDERQERIEEKEHYADYSDQEYDKASSNAGELI